jgi:hypothetical protein
MKTLSVIIKNLRPYPIRVFVLFDEETNNVKSRRISSLGTLGPIDVTKETYEHLTLNSSIKVLPVDDE